MKALHFSDSMTENSGGRTLFVLEFASEAETIAVLNTDMNDSRIVSIPESKGKISNESFEALLKEKKPDMCIFHSLKGVSSENLDAAKSLGLKIIFIVHDYYAICERYTLVNNKEVLCSGPYGNNCVHCYVEKYAVMNQLGRQTQDMLIPVIKKVNPVMRYYSERRSEFASLLERVDMIVYPTEKSSKIMSRFIDSSIKSKVIRQFTEKFDAESIKRESPVFAFIGHEAYHKGYSVLKDAVKGLMNNKFRMNVYGDFKERIKDSRVTYHPPFKHDSIGRIFSDFDILIFPSLWPEVHGRVICEAASCGKFVFASNLTAAEEILGGYKGLSVFAHNRHDDLIKLISKYINNWQGMQYPVKPAVFKQSRDYRRELESAAEEL